MAATRTIVGLFIAPFLLAAAVDYTFVRAGDIYGGWPTPCLTCVAIGLGAFGAFRILSPFRAGRPVLSALLRTITALLLSCLWAFIAVVGLVNVHLASGGGI